MQDRVKRFFAHIFFEQVFQAVVRGEHLTIEIDPEAGVQVGVEVKPAQQMFFPEAEILEDDRVGFENDLRTIRLVLFPFLLRL